MLCCLNNSISTQLLQHSETLNRKLEKLAEKIHFSKINSSEDKEMWDSAEDLCKWFQYSNENSDRNKCKVKAKYKTIQPILLYYKHMHSCIPVSHSYMIKN